jgi:membrane-bound metal-dependent hydrolase YbcI (DUF457 family)
MLIRTHLAIVMFAILLFLPHVSNGVLFFIVALIATFIPDVDNAFSTLGSKGIFRILQAFTKHRGVIHSFSFCILISILLAFFFPSIAFAFFLGYSVHLLADSLTPEGIIPFWPYSKKSDWHFKTGGRVESSLFLSFVLMDIVLLFLNFRSIFL